MISLLLRNLFFTILQPGLVAGLILRDFENLYWANKAWKENAINKACYWKDFTPERLEEIASDASRSWMGVHGKEYFDPALLKPETQRTTHI